MLDIKISEHLKKISQSSEAVKNQFYFSDAEFFCKDSLICQSFDDPLMEDEFEKTKGLIHKYENRALILLTLTCASYCRFCTRRRRVSDIEKGTITKTDIKNMSAYLHAHSEIKELIFSGGDPFTVPKILKYALKVFSKLPQIKIIRIGTRTPVANPRFVNKEVLSAIKKFKKPIYVMIHFEHPDEINKRTIAACLRLRKAGAMLFSQSVFLKGINDSYETLFNLFSRLVEIGVKPYYLYRCDPVKGIEHFRVDFKKEIEIATRLRKNLSGLAWPLYVIDTPNGSGKVPVPLNFWDFNRDKFSDFKDEVKQVI
jgi:lysine 2,3-aminomutase